MIATVTFVGLLYIASAGRTGIELGDLYNGPSKLNHGVRGNVSVVDKVTFYIANFSYDGKAPDAYFWAGTTLSPSKNGFIVRDELGTEMPLKKYENRNIIISLPENVEITDIKWLSIWCRNFTANFGHVVIPVGFGPPMEKQLPPLRGRAHKVSSGDIFLIDSKTIQINKLYYDGNGPDAFFLVGKEGSPNGNGIKVPDENGRLSKLRGYRGEVVKLRLPDPYTWFDLRWFAMYCIMAAQNFGEVYIRPPLNIPIDLSYLQQNEDSPILTNCQEIFPDQLLVRWKIIDRDIYIQLEGRAEGEYLAFGVSGSENRAQMVGADVVVVFYDASTSLVVAEDYYLTEKSQCSEGKGACPDLSQGGRHNIALINWRYDSGILSVTYKRRLAATEDKDKPINADKSTTVVAAIGSVNSNMQTAIHTTVTRDLLKIDFGKDGKKCDPLKIITKPKSTVKPWPPHAISDETIFRARIGPSGAERGYTPITGLVGWGIAWWINGLLIPELTVKRGVNYTFVIEGGDDSSYPAEYHPFYITNNKEGGGVNEKLGTPEHIVYAGLEYINGSFVPIGVGRYCEYQHRDIDRSLDFETFEEFKKTLILVCKDGDAGELIWTPDRRTPDLVYYQCYTHRNLGWKIHVTGSAVQVFVLWEWILVFLICSTILEII